MRRQFFLLALAALALFTSALAAPTRIHAQAPYINITEVRVTPDGATESKKKEIATPVFINIDECNGDFEFKLGRVATTVSVMEAWVTNTGARCTDPNNRSRINNNDPMCWLAGSESGVTGEYKYKLKGTDIFGRRGALGERSCPKTAVDAQYTIYFVPLASSSDLSGSMAPPALTTVIQPSANFTLYTQRPDPPSNVKARDGERELPVSWERINTNPRTKYRAFFDYGPPQEGQECGSGALNDVVTQDDGDDDAEDGDDSDEPDASGGVEDAGLGSGMDAGAPSGAVDTESPANPPRADAPSVLSVTTDTNAAKAALRNIDDALIPVDASVQVAVATIDPTGNVGYLSPRVCVKRVQTSDLLDLCEENPKDCGLETCSLSSSGRNGSAVGLSFLALALSAFYRRRRRSA